MIVKAACKVSIPNIDGYQIIPLHRRGDMGKIFAAFGYKPGACKILEFGFLDNKGNFYGREEAAEYMRKQRQKTRLGDYPAEELYSEDLY